MISPTKNSDFFSKVNDYITNLNLSDELAKRISFEEFAKKNPSYYLKYPLLFATTFNIENDKEIDQLCIAGSLYYRSIISLDQIYDNNIDKNSRHFIFAPLVISVCQEETIKILCQLFDIDSCFWSSWRKRKDEYLEAMILEKEMQLGKKHIDDEAYNDLAEKKSAIGKVAIDSLFILSEQTNLGVYEAILEAHRCFSIGLQYADDFQDFKEDMINHQVNWSVLRIKDLFKKEGLNIEKHSIDELKKHMYIRGVAIETLSQALKFYNKALNIISQLTLKPFIFEEVIHEKILETKRTMAAIEQYMLIYNKKIELSKVEKFNYPYFFIKNITSIDSNISKTLEQMINSILNDANKDFFETKHIMYLGSDEGFQNDGEIHVGDVFQRALILDLVFDLKDKLNTDFFDSLITNELGYLLGQKHDTGVGGWSYFPTVKEIAPDIDDLGQIVQCFSRTNSLYLINQYLAPLFEVVFLDNYNKITGGIETWIVPFHDRSEIESMQNYFNESKWGKGPDNEVVANFLYGITLAPYFAKQYAQELNKSIEFLFSQQEHEGFWRSRWYYGKFYGTYTCLRLFNKQGILNDKIKKAVDFIMRNQNEDGSWNNESGEKGILDTSFALLCLSQYPDQSKISIEKGIRYLINAFRIEPSVYIEPFILPKAGQPYKSKTMTTAYALKAIINNLNILK